MRVLVYGAGVIGCTLAHSLCKSGQDVTLLARGEWKETLERKGLVIKHYARFYTSHDRVGVIDTLLPEDRYDLIFVAVQYNQLPSVLPILARNISPCVALIGNNLSAAACQAALPEKGVAFGFLAAGGRRAGGRVISIYAKPSLTVGALDGELSLASQARFQTAFAGGRIALRTEPHMDAWLKCHVAFILPIAYVCYATGYRLRHATSAQIEDIMNAAVEAFTALKILGYPIRPDGEEAFFTQRRAMARKFLRLMAKTPLGRLAASDHCRHAVSEMTRIDEEFTVTCRQTGFPMPAWERLRKEGQPGRAR